MSSLELVSKKSSVTERGTHKRCHQMWDYASFNRQGLTARVATLPLNLGTLHHQTMDAWCENIINVRDNNNSCRTCKGLGTILADQTSDPEIEAITCPTCNGTRFEPKFDPVEAMNKVSAEMIKGIADNYKLVVGYKINRAELEPVFQAVEFGQAMIKMYNDYWGSPVAPEFELIKSEQTIVIPVCEAPCADCNGRGSQNISYEWEYGTEHESRECESCNGHGLVQLELEGTLDFIAQHKEAGYYVVGERKTYDKRPNPAYLRFFDQGTAYVWMFGQLLGGDTSNIAGIAYDGMWRRKEIPKGKTLDDMFLRTLLERNQHELDRFGRQIVDELRDMNDTRIYTNRRWEGCYDCQFRKLCDAETLGEDSDYIRTNFYMKRPRTIAFQAEDNEE